MYVGKMLHNLKSIHQSGSGRHHPQNHHNHYQDGWGWGGLRPPWRQWRIFERASFNTKSGEQHAEPGDQSQANHNLENQSISRQLSCDPSLIQRLAFWFCRKCSWNIGQQVQRPLCWCATRTSFLISSPKVSCTTDISLVDELEDTEESLKEEEEGRTSKSKVTREEEEGRTSKTKITREEEEGRATTSTVDQPVSRTVSPLERLKVTYQKHLFENITPIITSGVQIRVHTF